MLAKNTPAEIAVYAVSGMKILSQKHPLQKGSNSLTLGTSHLFKEMYSLQVKEGANSQAVKFIKSKYLKAIL